MNVGHEADERFAALVRRQSRFVFRVAFSVLRNTLDAEDAVQETFLKLYRGRSWENMTNERAFLARTAWRVAIDRLPKTRPEVTDTEVPSGWQNPEQAYISSDWSATVHRLIDALPAELRLPLALSTVDELNSREIAEGMAHAGIAAGLDAVEVAATIGSALGSAAR